MLLKNTAKSLFLATALVSLVFMAIGCNGKGQKSLTCISPTHGQTISLADDVSDASGIQIDVVCRVQGFKRGDDLYLWLEDEDRFEWNVVAQYDGSGEVTFTEVTFASGTVDDPEDYYLRCTDEGEDVSSATVMIHVVGDVICPEVSWLEPSDGFSWSDADDANDNPDDGFQHDISLVVSTTEGTTVSLYINGNIAGTANVADGQASFADITFPSASDINMEVRIGSQCNATSNPDYGISGTLDTAAPECQITVPTGTDWLNLSNDTDPGAGIQTQVVVSSSEASTAEIFVDDASQGSGSFSGGTATFENVSFADGDLGTRCLRAVCTDSAGNQGFSGESCFGVDSVQPTISITAPDNGASFNDDSDVNTDEPGVQIEVSVNSNQLGSTVELWSGTDCSGTPTPLVPEGTPTTDGSTGDATGQVSLGSTDGDHAVCARVQRPSGNVGNDTITVSLDTSAPQVAIVRPTPAPDPIPDPPPVNADDGLILMVDDAVPYDASTNPNYNCEYSTIIDCELIGQPVELWTSLDSTAPRNTAACETCTASDCTLPGRVTFTNQSLAQSLSVPYNIYAIHRDTAENEGRSSDVSVYIDTEPGSVSFITPTPACETEFRTADDPYLLDIRVSVESEPVTLTVTYDSGAPYTETRNQTGLVTFTAVPLHQGTNTVRVCAVDRFEQEGCTQSCVFTVADIPQITITTPADSTLFGSVDDADAGTAGFQTNVSVTSDVADGTIVHLEVGTSDPLTEVATSPYSTPGILFSNVTLQENSAVRIRALVTDTRGTGDDINTVTVDLTPPSQVITDLASSVVDRRGGDIRLSWTAPADGGLAVHDYDIRCNSTGISSDTDFENAPQYPFGGVPTFPGTEAVAIYNFFVGINTTYYCAIKSMDAALNKSSMSNVAVQPLMFLTATREGAASTADNYGFSVAPAGDVNNDTIEDFIVGSNTQYAYVYFGNASGTFSSTPNVTISGPAGSRFGSAVSGIGFFNGDTIADIAIGAWGANASKGAVYVFLGRATWPATLDTTQASITYSMEDPSTTKDDAALFGVSIAPAGNFDGDTNNLDDIVATAFGWDANRGAAFVLLGRTTITPGTVVNIPGDGTGLIGDFYVEGFAAADRFGIYGTGVGIVNSDGMDDIVIGARDAGGTGKAYLFYGRASGGTGVTTISSASQTLDSPAPAGARFGFRVAGIGDVNGDSRNDLMVSAPVYDGSTGIIYIFTNSGGTGFNTTPAYTIIDNSSNPGSDGLGSSLAVGIGFGFTAEGDVNGDGMNDIFCSTSTYGDSDGEGFIYMGGSLSSTMYTENSLLNPVFSGGGNNKGSSYIGDVNGDGYVDFINSYPYYSTNRGHIDIYY